LVRCGYFQMFLREARRSDWSSEEPRFWIIYQCVFPEHSPLLHARLHARIYSYGLPLTSQHHLNKVCLSNRMQWGRKEGLSEPTNQGLLTPSSSRSYTQTSEWQRKREQGKWVPEVIKWPQRQQELEERHILAPFLISIMVVMHSKNRAPRQEKASFRAFLNWANYREVRD
jgi:hypothetical protein